MNAVERKKQDRIREVAHRIWREEGCPDGRAEAHWQMAQDLVAVEAGYEHAAPGAAKGGGGRLGVEAPPRKTGATRRKTREG